MKIFDCFLFFNEIDLLELRLNILDEYVDYFVICEAENTHSNNYKGYIIPQHKDKFKKFASKIRYLQVDKSKFINTDAWYNENLQRNSLSFGIQDMMDEDICILSDLDEIPKPETILKVIKENKIPCTLTTDLYYGYLNTIVENHSQRKNNGSIILNKQLLQKYSNLQYFRNNKDLFENITNGGWHFSYLVGNNPDKAIEKIKSFAHCEFNNQEVISRVKNNLINGTDILSRGNQYKTIIDESNLPEIILNNKEKYKKLLK